MLSVIGFVLIIVISCACKKLNVITLILLIYEIFVPPLDEFVFLPSVGVSGGSIIVWNSTIFSSTMIFQNAYAVSIEFTSLHSNVTWILTNIYAPCTPHGKREFLRWFKHIHMPDHIDWLIVGDFNLYRSPTDRSREGADHAEIYLFNEAISALGLIELPLKVKRFT